LTRERKRAMMVTEAEEKSISECRIRDSKGLKRLYELVFVVEKRAVFATPFEGFLRRHFKPHHV
jgi:hypothetical protein